MDCMSCQHENPDDAQFCGECGADLAPVPPCPGCGHENPASLLVLPVTTLRSPP